MALMNLAEDILAAGFTTLFIFFTLASIPRVFRFLFAPPKKIDGNNSVHADQFFISNAGASLRTSIGLSIAWMVISNQLFRDETSWSSFLGTQFALELFGFVSLLLCLAGIIGIMCGRSEAVANGESWDASDSGNKLVTLYGLVTFLTYLFGFIYHAITFYF